MALIIVPDDFPLIQTAINNAASGDSIGVRPGNYNEILTDNGLECIQLFGLGGVPRVWSAAGTLLTVNSNFSWVIQDIEFDGVGTANGGVYLQGGYGAHVKRCRMHNFVSYGMYHVSRAGLIVNNVIWSCGTRGLYYSSAGGYDCVAHNTICKCGIGLEVSASGPYWNNANLCAGNTTDFVNDTGLRDAWNVSSDLTAPGFQSRTGFNTASFVNYAGNDFRLAAAGENGANFQGVSLASDDYLGNVRSFTTGVFYAGAHDPYVAPTGGAPTCLGIIDAQPWSQGCLLVRFYEMFCEEGSVPYRYDFHVKRLDSGVLTAAEIDAGTYYSCSFYNEEVNAGGAGSPFPEPAMLSVVLALESHGDIGDNIHLMTNRRYQIAVRAVAIDVGNVVYEEDNDVVVVSWSSGYQGITHQVILDWPCLELCADNPVQKVQITSVDSLPEISAGITSLPPLELAVKKMPNLNVSLDVRGRGRR